MKYRYYIADTFDGDVKGTNDPKVALEFAICEEYFVVDTETGAWMADEGETREIKEATLRGEDES